MQRESLVGLVSASDPILSSRANEMAVFTDVYLKAPTFYGSVEMPMTRDEIERLGGARRVSEPIESEDQ